MSDPADKKAKSPERPAAPQSTAQKPVRPDAAPRQTTAQKPSRPLPAPVASAQRPMRPAAIAPVQTTALRPVVPAFVAERGMRDEPRRSRSANRLFASSSAPPAPTVQPIPEPSRRASKRGEKVMTGFGGLVTAKASVRTETVAQKEFLAPFAHGIRVAPLVESTVHEPQVVAMVMPWQQETVRFGSASVTPLDGMLERWSRKAAGQAGYTHAVSTEECGGLCVGYSDADGQTSFRVQPTVDVVWFQSPEIPAWKSRVASTDNPGSGGTRGVDHEWVEIIRTILEPNADRVKRQFAKRWTNDYYVEREGTPETVGALTQALINEIDAEDVARAARCRHAAETIGPEDFARLWNLVLKCHTNPPPPPADVDAEDSPAETDAVITA